MLFAVFSLYFYHEFIILLNEHMHYVSFVDYNVNLIFDVKLNGYAFRCHWLNYELVIKSSSISELVLKL